MNISDAAVEAAAMAIYQNRTGMDWESRSEVLKATVRGEARAALEAAAPHLMAANWSAEDLAANHAAVKEHE